MAIPSGLAAQLMTAEESTYGTSVTPDRGFEFRTETFKLDVERIESKAIRAGQRIQRSDRWAPGKRTPGGTLSLELLNKGYGRWFKHLMGGVVTNQPDAGGNPTVYNHTFTLGDLPTGQTIQLGRPDAGGTVRSFTYTGCKVASAKFSSSVSEIVTFEPTIIAQDETTATALATISYPASQQMLVFTGATLTVAGVAMDVKTWDMEINNGLDDSRFFNGSALRKNPLEAGLRTATGNLAPELTDLTAYTRFTAGTEAALVVSLLGSTISTTYKYGLTITANIRFDGETPNVGDMGIVQQPLPYKVVDNGTTSLQMVYQTTDTTP